MAQYKLKAKDVAFSVAILVAVVLIVMFYVWHHAESTRLGYRIHELESILESLNQEIAALEAERAELLAPNRVESIAGQKLGFTRIRTDQIVDPEKSSGGKDRP